MTIRRSLGSALEITPAKRAFIQGERQQKAVAATSTLGIPMQADRGLNDREPTVDLGELTTAAPIAAAGQQRVPSLVGEVLIPLTTRIRPETASALRRAYLEHKLALRSPATQQEIVEAALTAWLRQYQFLK